MPPAGRVGDMHVSPMVTGAVLRAGNPVLSPCCPTVVIGDADVDLACQRCTEQESGGARMVDAILTHSVLPAISDKYLTALMEGREVRGVRVGVKDGEFTYEFA